MAELPSPDEFERMLSGLPDSPIATAPRDQLQKQAPGLAPDTRSALVQASEMLNKGLDQNMLSDRSIEMGLRPGVPFDLERGADIGTRAKLSFDSDMINQFKLLSHAYGMENVVLSKDGRFVIQNQVNPTTGAKEDFHVNPIGFDVGDVAGMSADALPILAGAVLAKVGGKFGGRPITRAIVGLAGMASGTELTAGVEEGISRLLSGNDIQPGTLAFERSKAALLDMGMGAFLASGTKTASKLGGAALGLLGIPTAESGTVKAAKELAQRTGIKMPLTPGEASESGLLMRLEATAKPSFGTVGVMADIEKAKAASEDELRRVFLGLPRTMTDEELQAALPKADITGQKVLGRLGTEAMQLEGGVAKAKGAVERAGTSEAQLKAGVNLESPLPSVPVGEAMRSRTVSEMDAFKGTMGQRYAAFEADPRISDRIVSGNPLAKVGQDIEAKFFPQKEVTKVVPTGLLGPTGAALTSTVTSTEPLESFVKSSVRKVVDELKGLAGSKVGISDMKRIRTSIDDSIAEGMSIPGTDVKSLLTVREQVTDTIRNSLGKIDPALLSEWDKLGADYAKGMQRFNREPIRQMLIKEGEQGSIGNAELARSVGSGQPGALDRYNDFKTFFGASSPEFKAVQQLARQNVLQGSLEESTGYISGARLRSNLRSVDPEIATELFGITKQELHRIGEALSVAQGNLDVNELQKLASSKSLTTAAIPDLIAAEKTRAQAWGNKLIKAAAKGSDIGEEVIQPSKVVRNITQMDPDQAGKVLGILSDRPDLLQDVRQLAIEDLWGQVQTRLKGGRIGASSNLIKDALGNDVQKRTWQTLLGNDVVENLELLSKIVRPSELSTRAFGSAGQMRATGEITQAEKGGLLNVAAKAAERFLIGTLYTGTLKQSIVNLATHQDQGRILNSVIASTPFVERVAERFGVDAPGIMQSLRELVEPKQNRELQIKGQVKQGPPLNPATMTPEEFDRWVEAQTR